MKPFHTPAVGPRYWAAITLASVFGTNLGDLYAHTSGLGLLPGVGVLAGLAAAACIAERQENRAHEYYYWLVIVVIRTGATNIADYLASALRIPMAALAAGLALLLGVLAWRAARARAAAGAAGPGALPATDACYWAAMLTAGVLGTVLGDLCEHTAGQGAAALGLGGLLAVVVVAGRHGPARMAGITSAMGLYWLTVAVARTAGTAAGDWLAESRLLHLGLPLSTALTGCAFAAAVVLWPARRVQAFAG